MVTATTSTVSYALSTNPGACNEALAVTAATWATSFRGSQATLDFASTATPPSVGSTITVSGLNPASFNGTFLVTASTATSVSYALSTNPGAYVSGGTVAVSASGTVSLGDVHFSFNGAPARLSTAAPVDSTGGGSTAILGSPTNAGYTEAGLTNEQFSAGTLNGGTFYPVSLSFDNTTTGPASFRFAYNRAASDIADAAAAAKGKSLAVVFLNDNGAPPEGNTPTALTMVPNPYYNAAEPVTDANPPYIAGVESLPANQTQLVEAVAAVNPNTVVVLNTTDPVLMPWVANERQCWRCGTRVRRAALPRPVCCSAWPTRAAIYPSLSRPTPPTPYGATTRRSRCTQATPSVPHLERLNGNGGCSTGGFGCPPDTTTVEDEGIYTDYRFFDKEGITPLFPFGWGLSYTSFAYPTSGSARPVTAAST